MQSLPAFLLRSNIRRGKRAVHAAGFLFVRADRSPGRIMLLCRDAWLALQRSVFLQSPRYSEVQGFSAEDFSDWATSSLQSLLKETGSSLKVRAGPRAGAPYAYWTIKNKSMLSAEVPRVKVRPIISHCCHPCRSVLSVAGRALALTVEVATVVVERKHPLHTPMWKLHAGSLAWVSLLSSRTDLVGCAEFDSSSTRFSSISCTVSFVAFLIPSSFILAVAINLSPLASCKYSFLNVAYLAS